MRAPAPPRQSDPVADGALAGMVLGLVVALPVSVSVSDVGMPTVVPLVGVVAGAVLGVLVGLRADRHTEESVPLPRVAEERDLRPRARLVNADPPSGRSDPSALGPGWHPDPLGGPAPRFWDGEQWTDHVWLRAADDAEPPAAADERARRAGTRSRSGPRRAYAAPAGAGGRGSRGQARDATAS